MNGTRVIWICGSLGLLVAALFLGQYHGFAPRGTDDQYYFAQARSLLIDHDLDLMNELGTLTPRPENIHTSTKVPWDQPTSTGRVACKYPIGTALLQLPFMAIGTVVAQFLGREVGTAPGYELPVYLAWTVGNLLFALLSIALAQRYLMKRFGIGAENALIASFGALLGGPLFFHAVGDPYMSHVPSALLVTALLAYGIPRSNDDSAHRPILCFGLGLLFGLALAVRMTNAAFVFLLLPVLNPWHSGAWLRLASIAMGAIVAFSPQMFAWHTIYGEWIAKPYAEETFDPWNPAFVHNFFGVRAGLFFWSPLWAIGFLAALARARFLVPFLCSAFALMYMNSSWWCWWWGDTYGGRAYAALYPLAAVGLAVLLTTRFRAIRVATLVAITCGTLWSMAMIYRVEHLAPQERAAGVLFFRN